MRHCPTGLRLTEASAWESDRLCAMLLRCESIRDVIAFPKNKKFQSLVERFPTHVEQSKLDELQLLSPRRG